MARKPVTSEMTGGKTPRQRVWERIRHYRGNPFELSEVAPGGVHIVTARSYVIALEKAGILAVTGKTPAGKITWKLVHDTGMEAPRVNKKGATVTQGNSAEAMWRTMRIIKEFTAPQLAAMASTETIKVDEKNARHYCTAIARAGYIMVSRPGKGTGEGGLSTIYRFVESRYTGPRAPMIQRIKSVFDPNTNKIVWQPTPEEILAESDHA